MNGQMASARLWLKLNEHWVFLLLAFAIPLVTRAIPEVLMGPFVVGFDPMGYYIPNTILWLKNGVSFWGFMATAPLVYLLLMGVTSAGVSIVLSLKMMAPLLLGFLGLSVYVYANKSLSCSRRKSLLAVLFATLYFVALRVSWDMLRSELALVFLFVVLIFLKQKGCSLRGWFLLSVFMVLVVFTHQIVSVIMFALVLATIVRSYLNKEKTELRRIIFSLVPAICLFLLVLYANIITRFPSTDVFLGEESGSTVALFGFASYTELTIDALGFLAFCFLPLLPLLVLGARNFKSNLQLKTWVFWVLLSLLAVIVAPDAFFGIPPYRWTLFLAYPLAFYAAGAFSSLKRNVYKAAAALILVWLSVGFLVLPNQTAIPYYDVFLDYVPKSMLQNTVSLEDCPSTSDALQWLKNNINDNAVLITHRAFYGWALLTLDEKQVVLYEHANPEAVARLTSQERSSQIYLIWWIEGHGWYGLPTVPSSFTEIHRNGNIAIYVYLTPNSG